MIAIHVLIFIFVVIFFIFVVFGLVDHVLELTLINVDSEISDDTLHEVSVDVHIWLLLLHCRLLVGSRLLLLLGTFCIWDHREGKGLLESLFVVVFSFSLVVHIVVFLGDLLESWLDVGGRLGLSWSILLLGLVCFLHGESECHCKLRVKRWVDTHRCQGIVRVGRSSTISSSHGLIWTEDRGGDHHVSDVHAALRHIEEVRLVGPTVGRVDHGLQSTNVVWVSKVNDIQINVVLLESHAQVFKVLLRALAQRVSNEDDDSLSLRLVLSVLEGQLGNLDGGDQVSLALDLDVIDTIDKVANLVCVRQSQFGSSTGHA